MLHVSAYAWREERKAFYTPHVGLPEMIVVLTTKLTHLRRHLSSIPTCRKRRGGQGLGKGKRFLALPHTLEGSLEPR